MTPTFLIYHPARQKTVIGHMNVYHDQFGGNEDPYIWHDKFLHTYCHITQLTNDEKQNQINFWVSGNCYPNFTQLFCDCVFVIAEKHIWTNRNHIDPIDPIVDNKQTFEHHYQWANFGHHNYIRRTRYTLKADSEKSFQPQDKDKNLIDIIPFLNENGITSTQLIHAMTSKRGSRPLQLDSALGLKLYDYLFSEATIKHYGKDLKNCHPNGEHSPQNTKMCGHC